MRNDIRSGKSTDEASDLVANLACTCDRFFYVQTL